MEKQIISITHMDMNTCIYVTKMCLISKISVRFYYLGSINAQLLRTHLRDAVLPLDMYLLKGVAMMSCCLNFLGIAAVFTQHK